MEVLGKKHVMTVVRTILQQLAGTTEVNVFSSWGVSKMYGTKS